MAQPFEIAAGDTLPALRIQCVGADGTPQDLTSATVTFGMKDVPGGTAATLSGTVSVDSGTSGFCQFNWASGDASTAGAGHFVGQFKVVLPSSAGTLRFPNDGVLIPIQITATAI